MEILDLNFSKRTNMNKNYLLFLIVCIVTTPIFSQGPSQQYLDMIGYEELLALYNDFESDSTTQKNNSYLQKSSRKELLTTYPRD